MTQPDCISNRNLKIISAYVKNRLGHEHNLFDGLPRPDGYPSAESFFLNEDQWTTYDNFSHVFRRAKKRVGEADFFFNCSLSSAQLRSFRQPLSPYDPVIVFNKDPEFADSRLDVRVADGRMSLRDPATGERSVFWMTQDP